jgi:GNAT superfamily N-acetyltransferase
MFLLIIRLPGCAWGAELFKKAGDFAPFCGIPSRMLRSGEGFCKPQVGGSSPSASSILLAKLQYCACSQSSKNQYDPIMKWLKGNYCLDTNKKKLDVDTIHKYLCDRSYWATGRSRETVERSIRNSMCFGIYEKNRQIGFARVITDYATFAWIADVFILEEFRGKGLSKWLMEAVIAHPRLQKFRRWVLATKDAHELYRRYGFTELKKPERWMERRDPQTEESPDYWQSN